MNQETFDAIVERRISLIKQTLLIKGKEYATKEDRLHNFKAGAAITGQHPAEACRGYFTKPLVSTLDIIRDVAVGKDIPRAKLDEKLGDLINYLILLEAIISEGMSDNEPWDDGRCKSMSDANCCVLDNGHDGDHVFLSGMTHKGDNLRCPILIKGEQCALRIGHHGGCKWGSGD